MPRTTIWFYRDEDGRIPFLDWLNGLPLEVQRKCRVRIERLRELGYELRRPEADYLRDGIHELRARHGRVHYRMLYSFHGRSIVVLLHGLVKKAEVPAWDIERARHRKDQMQEHPERHVQEDP